MLNALPSLRRQWLPVIVSDDALPPREAVMSASVLCTLFVGGVLCLCLCLCLCVPICNCNSFLYFYFFHSFRTSFGPQRLESSSSLNMNHFGCLCSAALPFAQREPRRVRLSECPLASPNVPRLLIVCRMYPTACSLL